MKIIVDKCPSCCSKCLYGIYSRTEKDDKMFYCKLINKESNEYEIHEECPLISLKHSLGIDITTGDDYTGKYIETTLLFNGDEVSTAKTYVRWNYK